LLAVGAPLMSVRRGLLQGQQDQRTLKPCKSMHTMGARSTGSDSSRGTSQAPPALSQGRSKPGLSSDEGGSARPAHTLLQGARSQRTLTGKSQSFRSVPGDVGAGGRLGTGPVSGGASGFAAKAARGRQPVGSPMRPKGKGQQQGGGTSGPSTSPKSMHSTGPQGGPRRSIGPTSAGRHVGEDHRRTSAHSTLGREAHLGAGQGGDGGEADPLTDHTHAGGPAAVAAVAAHGGGARGAAAAKSGNIQVVVRVRPVNTGEREKGYEPVVVCVDNKGIQVRWGRGVYKSCTVRCVEGVQGYVGARLGW
jgi:hypothetical protein